MFTTALITILLVSRTDVVAARADDPTETLQAARKDLLRGRYEEATEAFRKLLDDDQAGVAAALGLSRCHEATGQWDNAASAVEDALKRQADQPDLLARLAELAFARGQLDRALDLCIRAIEKNADQLLARWVQVQIADATGDAEAAGTGLQWFIRFFNAHEVKDADSLLIIGQASAEYAQRYLQGREQSQQLGFVLNEIFDAAHKADEDFWPAWHESGRLFLQKYKKGDALADLRRALAINPNAAELHVALGVAALQDHEIEAGHQHCDRALEINPDRPAARQLKADLFMVREQFAEAAAELEKARAVNPIDEETLARIAACHHFGRRAAEFDQLCEQVLARNPRPVRFYLRLAERLEDHRHFDLAEQFFNRAIEVGGRRGGPLTGLGMLFMRIGREEEAAKTLDAAFEADPFNVRTKNMLEVLDQLKGYKTIETEHFRVKVDEKLDGLFGKYAAKYLEEVYAELTERFGFQPEKGINIEVFNKGRGQSAHQWFSARTVGLPWIGTVGACTGKVVAMTSPAGVEKPFNWARVLKHEVSHVITLQQSRFNIPHWYTEALAVQCEEYPRSQVWNQLLLERVPAGELFNLDNINLAFARPKTALDWQMAYCQSELYAEYMQDRFGRDATARLLDAYRDGLSTTEAVEKLFQVPKSDFEAGYVAHLKKVAAGLSGVPAEPAVPLPELERAYAADPANPDAAARLANEYLRRKQYPKARDLASKATKAKEHHPLGSYVLARLSMVTGDVDRARELLEPALDREHPDPRVLDLLADLYTRAKRHDEAQSLYESGLKLQPGDSKWVAGLARIALLTGDRERLRGALEQLSVLEADDPSPRKKLAAMATEDKDWERAARYAWMTLHIDVADADAHAMLANASAALGKWPQAVDEYQAVRQLKPKDRSVLLKLARAYRSAGQPAAAIETAKELLAEEPENREARELLRELGSK